MSLARVSCLVVALLGAAAPVAAQSADPEDNPALAAAATVARVRAGRIRSADLRLVRAELASSLHILKRSAPGLHPIPGLDGALAGRTYSWCAFRSAARPTELELEGMVYAYLRPSPDDFVFYARAERVGLAPLELVKAFDTDSTRPEAHGRETLAAVIALLVARHPDLELYRVHGGWGDAVGAAYHGVAVVDPRSGEALWIFTEEVWYEG